VWLSFFFSSVFSGLAPAAKVARAKAWLWRWHKRFSGKNRADTSPNDTDEIPRGNVEHARKYRGKLLSGLPSPSRARLGASWRALWPRVLSSSMRHALLGVRAFAAALRASAIGVSGVAKRVSTRRRAAIVTKH
jgi:hypothetical protein